MKKYRIVYKDNSNETEDCEWYIKAKDESAAEQIFRKFKENNTEILDIEEM